jgi:hypothetical protein
MMPIAVQAAVATMRLHGYDTILVRRIRSKVAAQEPKSPVFPLAA